MSKDRWNAMVVIALIVLFVCVILTSCTTTRYVEIPKVVEKNTTTLKVDTIHQKDSVFEKVFVKGDTVFDTQYRYRYIYKDRLRVDSFIQRDSIPYPVEVVKYTNKLAWWQKGFCGFGIVMLLSIVLAIIISIKKFFHG